MGWLRKIINWLFVIESAKPALPATPRTFNYPKPNHHYPPRNDYFAVQKEHARIKFIKLISSLSGGVDKSVADDLRRLIENELFDYRKNARLLLNALAGYDWDFPRWNRTGGRIYGYGSVQMIHQEFESLDIKDKLQFATVTELKGYAKAINKKIGKNKSQIIADLADEEEQVIALITPIITIRMLREIEKYRLQVLEFIIRSSNNYGNCQARYDQLLHPMAVKHRPYFKWHCNSDAPKRCRKYDGGVLHYELAMQVFPKLPCNRPDCHCYITSQEKP